MIHHRNEESKYLDGNAGTKSIIKEHKGPYFGFKDIHHTQ